MQHITRNHSLNFIRRSLWSVPEQFFIGLRTLFQLITRPTKMITPPPPLIIKKSFFLMRFVFLILRCMLEKTIMSIYCDS